jgi:threonine dehydrogenase-like Zn-dependent dehydrogenase
LARQARRPRRRGSRAEDRAAHRLAPLKLAFEQVRRGGTVSLSGVYGGTADPLPMLNIFDKHLTGLPGDEFALIPNYSG